MIRYGIDSVDWQVYRVENGKRFNVSPVHWTMDGLAAWLDQAEADRILPIGDIHDLQTEMIGLRAGW